MNVPLGMDIFSIPVGDESIGHDFNSPNVPENFDTSLHDCPDLCAPLIDRVYFEDGLSSIWDGEEFKSLVGTDLALTLATPDGDFDEDYDVDGLDYLALQRGLGTDVGIGSVAPLADGNANSDQFIDDADFGIWEDQFGEPPPLSAAIANVPEPTTLALAGLGLVGAACCRRRGSTFFFPRLLVSAASPAARNWSRQRYCVGSETPTRRAIAAADSSLRNRQSTASRRSDTGTSLRLDIVSTPSGLGSISPSLPKKSLTQTIPKNPELYSTMAVIFLALFEFLVDIGVCLFVQ